MIERSRRSLTSSGLMAALALLVAVGCGGPNEHESIVTGTVTVDGELAQSGLVTFHPLKEGVPAIGRINSDGSYSLRTGQGDLREADGGTVIPGEYIVTVSITGPEVKSGQPDEGRPPTPGPSLVAAKYASTETSDLKHEIKPGSQVIVLELEPAEAATTASDEAMEAGSTQEQEKEAIPAAEKTAAASSESASGNQSANEGNIADGNAKGESP